MICSSSIASSFPLFAHFLPLRQHTPLCDAFPVRLLGATCTSAPTGRTSKLSVLTAAGDARTELICHSAASSRWINTFVISAFYWCDAALKLERKTLRNSLSSLSNHRSRPCWKKLILCGVTELCLPRPWDQKRTWWNSSIKRLALMATTCG